MKECSHDSWPIYKRLIGPLRDRARELGYALGVHGTLKRDIDLIACPWADDAVDAATLAEALRVVAASLNGGICFQNPRESDEYFRRGCPGTKPHGRLCWSFHLGGGPYLDISVMPKGREPNPILAEEYPPGSPDSPVHCDHVWTGERRGEGQDYVECCEKCGWSGPDPWKELSRS